MFCGWKLIEKIIEILKWNIAGEVFSRMRYIAVYICAFLFLFNESNSVLTDCFMHMIKKIKLVYMSYILMRYISNLQRITS